VGVPHSQQDKCRKLIFDAFVLAAQCSVLSPEFHKIGLSYEAFEIAVL